MVAARLVGMEKIDSWDTLTKAVQSGARVKYLHFWGHRPRPDGRIGASCLSQWWPSPFTVDGVEYATAEHWMMASKARLFGDAEAERKAVAASSPAQTKKIGRLVRGFDDAVWQRERFAIVAEGSVHKFAAHADLRTFLLGTGNRVLVEASPSTASGASVSLRTTNAPWTPPAGGAPTCWASH